jgi:hypothetical protein
MPNPIYVPLKEAVIKYEVDESVLTQLIDVGMIETKEKAGETLVVVEKNGNGNDTEHQTKEEIIASKYTELQDQAITLSQASEKYKVPRGTIRNWFYNSYVKPTDPTSYPMLFNEAEIAYCAEIYYERKQAGTGFYGAPLLDENGLPYELKHPSLAKYRRKKKTRPLKSSK